MLPIDKYLEDSGIDVYDIGNTFYIQSFIEPELLAKLSKKTDKILQYEQKIDYGSRLVGRIYDGEQILVEENNFFNSPFNELKEIVVALANAYTTRFVAKVNHGQNNEIEFPYKNELNDMWIVSQKAHDYNPPHDHRTKAEAGLSGVIYLKSPPQIDGKKLDGCFQFTYGALVSQDFTRFKFAERRLILPQPGLVILFPKTLCHEVFPFRGEGERRCISFNVSAYQGNDLKNNLAHKVV